MNSPILDYISEIASVKWQRKAAKFLFDLVDPRDFGWFDAAKNRIDQETNPQFARSLRREVWLRRLTQKRIRDHFDGVNRLYYRSSPKSDQILLRVDVDAHDGQKDARSVADFIGQFWFNGNLYTEPSTRGCSGYAVINISGISENDDYWRLSPSDINESITLIGRHIANKVREAGYKSKVEIQGGVDDINWKAKTAHRPHLGRLPRLPKGEESFRELKDSPVFGIAELLERCQDEAKEETAEPMTQQIGLMDNIPIVKAHRSNDAFERMRQAGCELARHLGRAPSPNELYAAYTQAHGPARNSTERTQRANSVAKWLAKNHDPSVSLSRGFESQRIDLFALIERLRTGRSEKRWKSGVISTEDISVITYAAERASFHVADRPARQFCLGQKAIASHSKALKEAGLVDGSLVDRHKIGPAMEEAQALGLVECLDEEWSRRGPKRGISRKWTIGPNHPRYAEFCRFAQNIEVKYITPREPVESQPPRTQQPYTEHVDLTPSDTEKRFISPTPSHSVYREVSTQIEGSRDRPTGIAA